MKVGRLLIGGSSGGVRGVWGAIGRWCWNGGDVLRGSVGRRVGGLRHVEPAWKYGGGEAWCVNSAMGRRSEEALGWTRLGREGGVRNSRLARE